MLQIREKFVVEVEEFFVVTVVVVAVAIVAFEVLTVMHVSKINRLFKPELAVERMDKANATGLARSACLHKR